jgi:hypothetical protein
MLSNCDAVRVCNNPTYIPPRSIHLSNAKFSYRSHHLLSTRYVSVAGTSPDMGRTDLCRQCRSAVLTDTSRLVYKDYCQGCWESSCCMCGRGRWTHGLTRINNTDPSVPETLWACPTCLPQVKSRAWSRMQWDCLHRMETEPWSFQLWGASRREEATSPRGCPETSNTASSTRRHDRTQSVPSLTVPQQSSIPEQPCCIPVQRPFKLYLGDLDTISDKDLPWKTCFCLATLFP